MADYAEKNQENISQTKTSSVYQNKSNEDTTLQLADNRQEVVDQKELQETINSSPMAMQLKDFQDMADSYTSKIEQPIQKKENNTGLPDNLKSGIENISGYAMDDVKVHYNSTKPAQLNAHAYAQGTDIHLGSGQEKHLPHEAWHVVQQKQGRVKATKQMKGMVAINDDVSLEKEADVMGVKALRGVGDKSTSLDNVAYVSSSIQRVAKDDLVVGNAYLYKGSVGYYSKFRLNKYNFSTAVGGALSAFKVVESELSNVSVASQSDLSAEIDIKQSEDIFINKEEEIAPTFSDELIEKAKKDTGGWSQEELASTDKIGFLRNVLGVARSIIPKAFNIKAEVGSGMEDYTNTAYNCKNELTYAYATDLAKSDIHVRNNYIHPAALERMYQIIKDTVPNMEASEADITGVCKDFASLSYGLILQNDLNDIYKPKLAFMHGHVYVEVDVDGQKLAVDAWFGGDIMPKSEHEKVVSSYYQGISEAHQADLLTGKDHQKSLDDSYENAELARLVWYQNESRYVGIARETWAKGKIKHPNRGSN